MYLSMNFIKAVTNYIRKETTQFQNKKRKINFSYFPSQMDRNIHSNGNFY